MRENNVFIFSVSSPFSIFFFSLLFSSFFLAIPSFHIAGRSQA
ncbi:hypothetical protein MmTuc01_2708 [Methanosarcina mazei Tuc01]|uniref:Uncharacterized protein n=1 Tax=Methanosarcina mazei Tuc01 TaxID=1236903 RepID=M1PBV1_METMZ|nr:hypothetical protein MmTuc01_2708 [Methanosarcina mazei Tuc01]